MTWPVWFVYALHSSSSCSPTSHIYSDHSIEIMYKKNGDLSEQATCFHCLRFQWRCSLAHCKHKRRWRGVRNGSLMVNDSGVTKIAPPAELSVQNISVLFWIKVFGQPMLPPSLMRCGRLTAYCLLLVSPLALSLDTNYCNTYTSDNNNNNNYNWQQWLLCNGFVPYRGRHKRFISAGGCQSSRIRWS